jgi:hypothetical protein
MFWRIQKCDLNTILLPNCDEINTFEGVNPSPFQTQTL